jgi:hypothetical protein
MSQTLELPERTYAALVEAARAEGVSPTEWIEGKLRRAAVGNRSEQERSHALERLLRHAGAIDLGHPAGTDSEQIDADLAREYGGAHGKLP